jgi:hypothetical protein
MKKLILFSLFLFLIACEPDDNTPVTPVNDTFDTTQATLVKKGTLVGIGHMASGTASIYERDGKYTVVLDPYESQNGPDLKIYLSKDADATEYVRLGNLKSTTGKQSYGIPDNTNVADFGFVHVWCERFTVVFARAEVK